MKTARVIVWTLGDYSKRPPAVVQYLYYKNLFAFMQYNFYKNYANVTVAYWLLEPAL